MRLGALPDGRANAPKISNSLLTHYQPSLPPAIRNLGSISTKHISITLSRLNSLKSFAFRRSGCG